MDTDDLALIRTDAAAFTQIGDDLALEFYAALFELSPESRAMFPEDLAAQRTKLLDELSALVDLATHLEAAGPAGLDRRTAELGRRHDGYGTGPDHYLVGGEALLLALEATVPGWTDDHRDAWARLYQIVSDAMMHPSPPAD
ncbi:MAG: globin domain-containing protein [Actinomycetota bacterium]